MIHLISFIKLVWHADYEIDKEGYTHILFSSNIQRGYFYTSPHCCPANLKTTVIAGLME
jgi:hypothetical protein